MDSLIPSSIRIVRRVDYTASFIALFHEFESKSSAVRAEDCVRLLDFPDPPPGPGSKHCCCNNSEQIRDFKESSSNTRGAN